MIYTTLNWRSFGLGFFVMMWAHSGEWKIRLMLGPLQLCYETEPFDPYEERSDD